MDEIRKSLKWDKVNRDLGGPDVQNALKVIDLILALPPSATENERGFSQMKLLKTGKRQNLGQKRMNNCLHVRLNGVDIEDFNPDAAIKHWLVIINQSL